MKQRSAAAVISLCWIGIATLPASCQAQTLTTLASFVGPNGSSPLAAGLVQASDGNLYGTTSAGGTSGNGTVFRITPGGTLTTLYNFTGAADGANPQSGLIQASDGNLYGTTEFGGTIPGTTLSGVSGTVFRITPGGTETTLYSFCSQVSQNICTDGENPQAGLIQASDGNLYGTTVQGGAGHDGTVFRITPVGTLTTLYSFFGDNPQAAGLIQASDGSLYGTTPGGGSSDSGTVFRITTGGTLTFLYSFCSQANCADGGNPQAGLIQASDGNLYGTTLGTVFRITLGGTLTTLYSFDTVPNGGSPQFAGLIQASDGNLYGTTYGGGTNGDGTVFRITPGGTLTTLHSFTDADGAWPQAGLIQASDGNLYGTTNQGGTNGLGTVFRLTIPAVPVPAPSISSGGIVPIYSTVATIQPGEWVSIFGTNLASSTATWTGNFPTSLGGTSVTINGKPAYLWYVSPTQINLQAPDDTATGSVPVVVTTASGTSTSTVTLAQFAPSFLLLDSKHVTGIILRSNGTGAYGGGAYDIIGPTGNSLGYPTVAAKAGDTVELFAVGLGPTSPPVEAGQVFSGAAPATYSVNLLINNVNVTPTFAGLSGAGLYQINLTVPAGLGTGDVPLVATVGGVQTPPYVVISLQNGNIAPTLQSLTLSPTSVASGGTVQGTVTLSTSAPTGGVVVALSSNSSAASVPATVTVPAGATSTTFTIAAGSVSSNQTATITASYGGGSAQAILTVTAPPAGTVTFSKLTSAVTFQPAGYASMQMALSMLPENGNVTYSMTNGPVTWTGCTASNQGLTYSCDTVAQGLQLFPDAGTDISVTGTSLVINLTPGALTNLIGTLSGTLTVSGPIYGTSSSAAFSGPLSGTYIGE